MAMWKCSICDEEHDELPMDIAYARPQHYFEIPAAERDERVWFSDESNADLCVIDRTVFLIRAFLPVPVEGGKELRHGVWVEVDEGSFRKYVTLEGDGRDEPPFEGRLSSEVPGYTDTFLLPVEIKLGNSADRPAVRLKPGRHLFSREQRAGITLARAHELVREALPEMFK
jgi:hypothetical protein